MEQTIASKLPPAVGFEWTGIAVLFVPVFYVVFQGATERWARKRADVHRDLVGPGDTRERVPP